jgi:hypothetical protein
MSLETSYEVLEMLRDDGVQTFRAKEKATGRGLELHLFLPFGRPENKALFDKLKALPLETRRKFLDVGIDGSTPYVVTDPLPGNRGFKGWAEELLAGSQAPSGFNTGIFNAAPSRDDGVQILQAGQWRTGTPIPDSLVSKPPAPPPSRPAPAPTGDTGDFTRMFQAPDFLSAPQPPTPSVPVSAPPPGEFTGFFQAPEPAKSPLPHITQDVNSTTGEFTGLFEAKKPAVAPPSPAPAAPPPVFSASAPPPAPKSAPEPAAGEFTRMFQAPPSAASFQQPSAPPPPPKTQSEPSGGAEFTKYFENPLRPGASGSQQPTFELPPPPPPPAAKRGGDFTDVFGRPPAGSTAGSPGGFSFDSPAPPPPPGPVFGASAPTATGAFSAQPAWSQPQAQQTFPSGPSEYTKMMSAAPTPMGSAPSVFNAAPTSAPPAQLAAKKSNTPIFIAIGAVVLLIIGIVVFLLMQHSGATTPAAK